MHGFPEPTIRKLVSGAFFVMVLLSVIAYAEAEHATVTVWHSYRGQEQEALEKLALQWNQEHSEVPVELLALPYDAFANKLTSAIPRGHGPDLFIAAHERVGDWVRAQLLSPLGESDMPKAEREVFLPQTTEALSVGGTLFGIPLAVKSPALFVNMNLVHDAPKTTDEMLAVCRKMKAEHPERFCLAYEAGSFYHHAAWLHGFGGSVFNAEGNVQLDRPENAASLAFTADLTRMGFTPEEPTSALVAQLFNEGKAAFVVNGPWFLGEIAKDLAFGVFPLPTVSSTGKEAKPYLTVEAVFLSAHAKQREQAIAFARYLAGENGAALRLKLARQTVTLSSIYQSPNVDPVVTAFKEQAERAVPMPNDPLMRSVWEPAAQALREVLRGASKPEAALKKADARFRIVTRPAPEEADPVAYLLAALFVVLVASALIWRKMKANQTFQDAARAGYAYAYLAPAALSMVLLVFIPFVVGTCVSFFLHQAGTFTFVGLANFGNILTSADYRVTEPYSFYFTLVVTILWTSANVVLHVSIGLLLALLLREPWMKLRGLYRVLLIIPWAVPNYITALIWKGMFHKQFGAINALLSLFGVEPVSWFSHFATAFSANLVTNTWLGFPFMMVVTLGALQSIPKELEEAAEVDGASAWQRFVTITLPLLRPALLPAVILGSVWTFNMFNIIYLVSGGEPDGATEILISEAYRWAFSRQEQYGYAAAYGTLIFLVLLLYSRATRHLVKE